MPLPSPCHNVGLSDPYCVVGILNKEHLETKTVKQNNLSQWVEENLIRETKKTGVKYETLTPYWNEELEL